MRCEAMFRTNDPYTPLTEPGSSDNKTHWLRYTEKILMNSIPFKWSYVSNTKDSVYIDRVRQTLRVRPVIGFVRTGRMDTPVNVVVTARQWSTEEGNNRWIDMQSWTGQIPANVDEYTMALAPSYHCFHKKWIHVHVALEHAYHDEGIAIDQYQTYLEAGGNGD